MEIVFMEKNKRGGDLQRDYRIQILPKIHVSFFTVLLRANQTLRHPRRNK
jgi:hypothetical protein